MKVLEFNFCGGKLCLSAIATDFDVIDLQCLCLCFFILFFDSPWLNWQITTCIVFLALIIFIYFVMMMIMSL